MFAWALLFVYCLGVFLVWFGFLVVVLSGLVWFGLVSCFGFFCFTNIKWKDMMTFRNTGVVCSFLATLIAAVVLNHCWVITIIGYAVLYWFCPANARLFCLPVQSWVSQSLQHPQSNHNCRDQPSVCSRKSEMTSCNFREMKFKLKRICLQNVADLHLCSYIFFFY